MYVLLGCQVFRRSIPCVRLVWLPYTESTSVDIFCTGWPYSLYSLRLWRWWRWRRILFLRWLSMPVLPPSRFTACNEILAQNDQTILRFCLTSVKPIQFGGIVNIIERAGTMHKAPPCSVESQIHQRPIVRTTPSPNSFTSRHCCVVGSLSAWSIFAIFYDSKNYNIYGLRSQ